METEEVQFLYSVKLKQKNPSAVYYQVRDEEEESEVEYLYTRQFFEPEEEEASVPESEDVPPSIVYETPEPSAQQENEEMIELSVQQEDVADPIVFDIPEVKVRQEEDIADPIVPETPEVDLKEEALPIVSETPELIVTQEEDVADPIVVETPEPRRSDRKRKQTDFLVAQKQYKI
mgnify:CR=1 FL=1